MVPQQSVTYFLHFDLKKSKKKKKEKKRKKEKKEKKRKKEKKEKKPESRSGIKPSTVCLTAEPNRHTSILMFTLLLAAGSIGY